MLDLRFIRTNPDVVRAAIANKGEKAELDRLLELDAAARALIVESDELKRERNVESEAIASLKKAGEDASGAIAKMREVSARIKEYDEKLSGMREEIERLALMVPNMPHESVPVGKDEDENVLVREWGEPHSLTDGPVPHWEIGETLGILNFKAAAKLAGSNFPIFVGAGARLERALIQFMLDTHTTEHGYTEVAPPILANRQAVQSTGQIPKLEDDMYHIEEDDLFLISTGEVPLTNLHRDEIIPEDALPYCYTTYTPCFRREAGSYGRDTRGLVRVHQFDKVEMMKYVKPETSYDELEKLTANAETILQRLDLPYRLKVLCTGDLSFSAAKCYDIDIWSAGVGKWLEISSCSNFEDFQARRAGIKYKPADGGSPRLVHTLNGSGTALARAVVAILENYQTADGKVVVPDVLRPYMGGLTEIS